MITTPTLTQADLADATSNPFDVCSNRQWRDLLTGAMALCVSHYRPEGVRPPDSWMVEQLVRVGFLISEINGVGLDAIAQAVEAERRQFAEQRQTEEV